MRAIRLACGCIPLSLLVSCGGGPSSITPPKIDPTAAAQAAIAQYDKNNDQLLSAEEIESSAISLEKWDANRDRSVDQSEIVQRLERYVQHGTGMSGLSCYVRFNNQPLADAKVTFQPEEFLDGAIQPAYGTTGSDGAAAIAVAEEYRPKTGDGRSLEALQIGLYKVEISHPEVSIREVSPNNFELAPGEEFVNPTFTVR